MQPERASPSAAAPSSGSRGRPLTHAAARRRRQSKDERCSARRRKRLTGGSFRWRNTSQPSPQIQPIFRLRMCCFIIEEGPFFFPFLRDPPGSQMKWEGRRRVDRRGAGNAVFIWQSGDGIKGLVVECSDYSL